MRKYEVIGFKNVNYKSRKTGNQVEGYTLYLTSDPVTPDISGLECKEVFISRKSSCYSPVLGDIVHVYYSERGFVEEVVSC